MIAPLDQRLLIDNEACVAAAASGQEDARNCARLLDDVLSASSIQPHHLGFSLESWAHERPRIIEEVCRECMDIGRLYHANALREALIRTIASLHVRVSIIAALSVINSDQSEIEIDSNGQLILNNISHMTVDSLPSYVRQRLEALFKKNRRCLTIKEVLESLATS